MRKRVFTEEEVFDFIEDNTTVHVSSNPRKHGCVCETYVVKYEDSYWKFSFLRSDNEGWEIGDGVQAVEVVPKEKIIIDWVIKE